jgi:hypothetical protein
VFCVSEQGINMILRYARNATTPYSDYDSLGQYFINGSVSPASADEIAPEPDPMGFAGAPSGMTATAASSSAINLAWTDASNDEIGFTVERSPNGSTNWVVIADLGVGMDAYSDAGLDAATQYFYRVSAYKSKGKHGVILGWPAAVKVDVYRDGNQVESAVTGGSYDDFIGQKGGATYEHQVCESGGDTNCSNVTTTIF